VQRILDGDVTQMAMTRPTYFFGILYLQNFAQAIFTREIAGEIFVEIHEMSGQLLPFATVTFVAV
jgi:hypothetical protein